MRSFFWDKKEFVLLLFCLFLDITIDLWKVNELLLIGPSCIEAMSHASTRCLDVLGGLNACGKLNRIICRERLMFLASITICICIHVPRTHTHRSRNQVFAHHSQLLSNPLASPTIPRRPMACRVKNAAAGCCRQLGLTIEADPWQGGGSKNMSFLFARWQLIHFLKLDNNF